MTRKKMLAMFMVTLIVAVTAVSGVVASASDDSAARTLGCYKSRLCYF